MNAARSVPIRRSTRAWPSTRWLRGKCSRSSSDYYPTKQTIPMLMAELGYPCELIDGDEPVFRFIIQKV